jgi:superfamily I DNA/RNA helicase
MDMRFSSLAAALHQESREAEVLETIEFFPQEGKYHYDGHRKCAVYRSPEAAAGSSAICPVCHKPLTRGVMGRVLELADFPVDECARCPPEYAGTNRRPYHSLIPLKELLGELLDVGSGSKKVEAAYRSLIEQGGSELSLLMDAPTKTLERLSAPGLSGERLALAIERMRQGAVSICPGYDGVYGIIRAFPPGKTGSELPGITPPEAAESGEAGNGFDCSGEEPRKTGKRETLPRKKRAVPDPAAEQPLSPPLFQAQPEQEQVICYEGKYALIVAGPGSGKTATLAARIARLFRQGTAPESIVAVSFTVKAAWELRERIARTLGTADASAACGITVGTFHSLCVSLLREQGERQGIPRDFTILKEAERDALLQGLCAELPGRTQPEGLGKYIESRKRFLLLPGEETPNLAAGRDFLGEAFRFPQVHAALEQGYGRYQARLRSRASLDFDDLVLETVRLLAADAAQASWYRERFRHILVDEYQDINFAQYVLIRLLAGEGPAVAALWVIGDPNQAIYRFRGSDPRFIDRFCSDYPEAVRFHLSRSFRCAVAISNAAGKLMDTPLTGADGEARLFRTAYPSEQAEAEGIARRISRLIGGTTFFALDSAIADGREGPALRGIGDCAILLRTLALAAPITKALGDHGIPFILSSEKPWWEEEPVCSLLAMLRNSSGAGTDRPTEAVRRAWDAFPRKARRKQDAAWEEQVERLISIAAWYDRLPLFLDTLTAGGATSGGELGREGVAIMSIHASKGLEFDQVFVPALEEGLLPFTVYDGKADEAEKAARLEEEKRLLYVAMTRARTGLYLSWARKRMFQGRKLENRRSHFLDTLESMIPLYEDQPRRRVDLQLRLF